MACKQKPTKNPEAEDMDSDFLDKDEGEKIMAKQAKTRSTPSKSKSTPKPKAGRKRKAINEGEDEDDAADSEEAEEEKLKKGRAKTNKRRRRQQDEEDEEESESKDLDSDFLDDDKVEEEKVVAKKSKAKTRSSPSKRKRKAADSDEEEEEEKKGVATKRKTPSKPTPKRKRKAVDSDEEEAVDTDEDAKPTKKKSAKRRRRQQDSEEEEEGDDAVVYHGDIVHAPTTGLAPEGQISQHTLDFLKHLRDPECNDREWFKRHEPLYRHIEKEWKSFVEAFTDELVEIDDEIPPLPPKDVVHRIYRDVRFSNDKTPYKSNFSASFSRSGRKGIFAGYHVSISSGGRSLIAAGTWSPGKAELDTIRANIKHDSSRLRTIISSPSFVEHFGPPTAPKKGKGKKEMEADGELRQSNMFGHDSELKTAPKGVPKDHPEIDLLKCRAFFVVHRFADSDVVGEGFVDKLKEVIGVVRPFVHCLNDMMTIRPDETAAEGDGEEGEEE